MAFIKSVATILVLCLVCGSLSKPLENDVTARGIGSTLWDWITFPFSWWSSEVEEPPAGNGQQANPTPGLSDTIEIGKRNVTVWCNDQTCTTMKCDRAGCSNVTCNIYDTNMSGECREYQTPAEFTAQTEQVKPTSTTNPISEDKITDASQPSETIPDSQVTNGQTNNSEHVDEQPLELEAIISSTVTENAIEKNSISKSHKTPNPHNLI